MRQEFRLAWSLLPFAAANVARQWSGRVYAVDASMGGTGMTTADPGPELAGQVGRVSERARFRGPLKTGSAPRTRTEELALEEEAMASVTCEADLAALGGDASFPERSARNVRQRQKRKKYDVVDRVYSK